MALGTAGGWGSGVPNRNEAEKPWLTVHGVYQSRSQNPNHAGQPYVYQDEMGVLRVQGTELQLGVQGKIRCIELDTHAHTHKHINTHPLFGKKPKATAN